MNDLLTLKEVRSLALTLDCSGLWWLHADRRHLRAFTDGEWSIERKAQWKATARGVYPWATISLNGPRRLVWPGMEGGGRNLLTEREEEQS